MTTATALLSLLCDQASARGVFSKVELLADRVRCHAKDCPEELVEEELAELGWHGKAPTVKHFRDEAKLYTFENPIPRAEATYQLATVIQFLFAYEAAFRALGDVGGGDKD